MAWLEWGFEKSYFQYNQLLPVSDIVAAYYEVDENAVIWLSTIVHVFQFILELPTAFLSSRVTLR